jgi:large exoprotein involved in heme utilization and adhesion
VQLLNRSSLWNPLSSVVGGIQVQGDRVTVNNSQIAAIAGGNPAASEFPGGNITINAATALELAGANAIYPFSSWIVNQVAPGASNAGGAIQLTTPRLNIQDGSRVQTLSQGSGGAGNIQVDADRIVINGTAAAAADPTQQDLFHSRITSDAIASGNGGNLNIAAQRINLSNGGQISTLVAPQAAGQGGEIQVRVSEGLTASGLNPLNSRTSSGVESTTVGTGNGGNIRLSGDRFTLSDGGTIRSQTLAAGRAGDITVRARDTITAQRGLAIQSSGIASYTFGSGDSGNIDLSTNHLRLYGSYNVGTVSASKTPGVSLTGLPVPNAGNAGSVRINARESIEISGTNPLSFNASSISALTLTSGNTGDIDIATRRLSLRQGGSIVAGVLFSIGNGQFVGVGTGNGGDIRVNVTESIDLQGLDQKTDIFSTINTFTAGHGSAGNLLVQAPEIRVRDGATIGTLNSATGQAGRVLINADRISVSGIGVNGSPSEVFATVRIPTASVRRAFNLPAVPTGDSGELRLNVDHLTVTDGGRINVQHQGIGNAGQLSINANTLTLENQGRIIAVTASGQGGNIRLNVRDRIMLRDRSQISTTAKGDGDGGNIRIDSGFLIGLNDSDIIAQAQAGRGGNIDITSESILGITPRPSLTAASDINASSQLGLNGSVNIENPNVKPDSGLIDLPSEVMDSSQQIVQNCDAAETSQFVVTGRGGIPENPRQMLTSDRLWSDLRELPSGTDAAIIASPTLLQEASTWRVNAAGQTELVANGNGAIAPVATCAR